VGKCVFQRIPPIGLIILYQVAIVTETHSSSITHCMLPVYGPTFRSWAAPVNAPPRRLPNMIVAVGIMLREPSKKVLMTDRGQIALDDRYTYQRADICRHYKMGAHPSNMNLSNPAPGVMIHAEVEIGDESGALQMIAPVQADLLLLP
jgi:hypothetical protein